MVHLASAQDFLFHPITTFVAGGVIGGIIQAVTKEWIGVVFKSFGTIRLEKPKLKIIEEQRLCRIQLEASLYNDTDKQVALVDLHIVFYKGKEIFGEFPFHGSIGNILGTSSDVPPHQLVRLSGLVDFPSIQDQYGSKQYEDMAGHPIVNADRVCLRGRIVGRRRSQFFRVVDPDFQSRLKEWRDAVKAEADRVAQLKLLEHKNSVAEILLRAGIGSGIKPKEASASDSV